MSFVVVVVVVASKQQASITKHGFHEMKRLISQEAGQDGDRMQLGRLM